MTASPHVEQRVEWTCPKCSTANVDFADETAFPLCGGCDETFEWCEITECP